MLGASSSPCSNSIRNTPVGSRRALRVLSAVALSRLITDDGSWVPRAIALSTFTAATVVDTREALAARSDAADAKYLATSVGVGTGANLALGGVAGLISSAHGFRKVSNAGPVGRSVGGALGALGVAAALGYAGRYGASGVIAKISAGNRATEIAYSDAPSTSNVDRRCGIRCSLRHARPARSKARLRGRLLDDIEEIMHEPAVRHRAGVHRPRHGRHGR